MRNAIVVAGPGIGWVSATCVVGCGLTPPSHEAGCTTAFRTGVAVAAPCAT